MNAKVSAFAKTVLTFILTSDLNQEEMLAVVQLINQGFEKLQKTELEKIEIFEITKDGKLK